MADSGLFRIDGKDADAIGEQLAVSVPVPSVSAPSDPPNEDAIWNQLRQVYDPEIPVNIVDLGLVYSMDVETEPDGSYKVFVAMTLTSAGCGMGPTIAEDARNRILAVPGVGAADVRLVWEPVWSTSMISEEGKMKLGIV
jgi:probable FeS assembly SUF system protein SufT